MPWGYNLLLYKYRLLIGGHAETDPKGKKVVYQARPGQPVTFLSTNPNHLKRNGSPSMQPKFEFLGEVTVPDEIKEFSDQKPAPTKDDSKPAPADEVGDQFSTMTLEQLQAHASAEEIDLEGAETESDIRDMIRAFHGNG